MSPTRRPPRCLIALFTSLLFLACGPGSTAEDAPAMMEVSPVSLDFQANQDSLFLEIANTGGKSFAYTIKVGAESGGVTWLKVSTPSGAVEGGASRSILVSVAGRGSLQPGTYTGQITVEAEGLAAQTVPVTMVVGQPVLAVDPEEGLDFGANATTQTLTIRNAGDGPLIYTVLLPDAWLTTTDEVQKSLAPETTDTLQIEVNRSLVPWYGAGAGELVVKSNGLTDDSHAGTITVSVGVETDDFCVPAEGCALSGYYCDPATQTCRAVKDLGAECSGGKACKSGFCVEGFCCDSACTGACMTCGADAAPGLCSPVPDETACDDGLVCTVDDSCQAGDCVPGEPMDCSEFNTACVDGVCDEAEGGCVTPEVTGKCIIDGDCYDGGETNSAMSCQRCLPETSADSWTLDVGFCVIDGACREVGASQPDLPCMTCQPGVSTESWVQAPQTCLIDGACVGDDVRHPENPCKACLPESADDDWSNIAAGAPCDDADACTLDDQCSQGMCAGQPMPCDDGFACTADACVDGACVFDLLPDQCLIDDACVAAGAPAPGVQCLGCVPAADDTDWSPAGEGEPCQTGLYCQVDGQCAAGTCAGTPRDCGGDQCVDSYCIEEKQECALVPKDGGEACDDTDPCTVNDVCTKGECAGSPKDCDGEVQLTPCSVAACDAASQPEPGACYAQLVAAGTPCDDGQACTQETQCDAKGSCDAGSMVTDQQCADELAISGPCATAWCEEPDGCASELLVNGTPCPLPHADAQCVDGTCQLVQCQVGTWDDCDEEPVNGCETDVASDLEHCGECGTPCALPHAFVACDAGSCELVKCFDGWTNCDGKTASGCDAHTADDPSNCGFCGTVCDSPNTAKVGVCHDGECALEPCLADQWNLDGDPANGCECTEGGEELCNQTDDNCDGQVDEGFDLMTDLDNCGGCGNVCPVDGADSFACRNGVCVVSGCPDGFVDRNGLADDGCEFELFAAGELWVDSVNGLPGAAGTMEAPFAAIAEAVAVAKPSTLIHVLPGVYAGGFTISQVGTVLVGAGADQVTITAPNYGIGVEVAADEVVLRGLTIQGGRIGIHVSGDAQVFVDTLVVSDVVVSGQAALATSATQSELDAMGLYAAYVKRLSVLSSTVSGVVAGAPDSDAFNGGRAFGLRLHWCEDTVVSATTFTDITGGQPASNAKYGSREGGLAAAILATSSVGGRFSGNSIADVTGGDAVSGGPYGWTPGTGGVATGLYLSATTGLEVTGNALSSLVGGKGALGKEGKNPSADQVAFGFYLAADALDNTIALSNTVEGEPVVFLNGAQDLVISGLTLTGTHNPTNWGIITVLDSENVTIADNEIAHFRGETGSTTWVGETGGDAVGVRLTGCTGCRVMDNRVRDIVGGSGGRDGGGNQAGNGGSSVGVLVQDSPGCTVAGNHVGPVQGGTAGRTDSWYPNQFGTSGAAIGYRLLNSPGTHLTNNAAYGISRAFGNTPADLVVACVHISTDSPQLVEHLSCAHVGQGTASPAAFLHAAGVSVDSGTSAPVQVLNSIVADSNGYGLRGVAGNASLLSANYSDFSGCAADATSDATLGVGCLAQDPVFVNSAQGNLHLQPTSPCIDAGSPAADCVAEPAPNGCRVNMGAYGNTADATAKDGAEHCNICPQ